MSSLVYLYLAYAAAVLIIGAYVLYLVRRVTLLRADLERLKQRKTGPPQT